MNFKSMNSFIQLLILLLTVIVCSFLAFMIVYYEPDSPGRLPYTYEIKEVYRFEPWQLNLGEIELSYPKGGIIIPAYEQEQFSAAIIKGPGVKPIFLALDGQKFESLKKDIIFVPVKNNLIKSKEIEYFYEQPHLPLVQVLGFPRVFPPPANAFYLHFLTGNGQNYPEPIYSESGERIYCTASLYSLLTVIILLVILILSLDYPYPREWDKFFQTALNPAEILGLLFFAALAFTTESMVRFYGLETCMLFIGYGSGALILFLLSIRKISSPHLGLKETAIGRSMMLAIAIAVLLTFLAAFKIPIGIKPGSFFQHLLIFLLLLLTAALGREIVWRGYIQATLMRLAGPWIGLFSTAILAGAMHILILYFFDPYLLQYPFTLLEGLLFAPAGALIFGLLYLRTKSILGSTLLHALLLFLPEFLVF